jgi:hypothetical protein
MKCNNVPRTGARCYNMNSHKRVQIFIKNELRCSYEAITLKINFVANIVHSYYFHTRNTRTESDKFATTSPGPH